MDSIFDRDLPRTAANHRPLTPLSFLDRAADVFPDRTAIVHGLGDDPIRRSYAEFAVRAGRLASALTRRGIGRGDTVSALLPNVPAMLEAHYGVPATGAVLNALNVRLDARTIAFQIDHSEAKAVIVDREFAPLLREALALATRRPLVIDAHDPEGPAGEALPDLGGGTAGYEALLSEGDPAFRAPGPADEWDAIALNYTSGTTGDPKGVVYHHRGAALLATGNVLTAGLAGGSAERCVYLWTLPMFHCNGWCFPWTLSLVGGTHVCLRQVRAGAIFELMAREAVTHLCGAPIVMSTLLAAPPAERRALSRRVTFLTAAAPPPEAVLAAMGEAGFDVTHVYGLTEVYGPAVVNEWRAEWDALPSRERAALKARQGVRYPVLDALDVLGPDDAPVPADGETLGEVAMAGNVVMKGYLKNPAATQAALRGGWFRTGDLGVRHPDGYVQLKDRAKDIIISGGENISSIEVEDALYRHAAVAGAAVVAMPDEKWGERPCAFVELKPDATADEAGLLAWCRGELAAFKAPARVVFGELPKTSTGKVQKFELRRRAADLAPKG